MADFAIDIHRVWRPVLTSQNIQDLLCSRLTNQSIERLDVYDFKEFLDLRSLRFAERLFAMIDIRGQGFVPVEAVVNFMHSFESQDLRSRVHLIFLCYDRFQRGSLTFTEIKTMLCENLIEGGFAFDHSTVELLTKHLVKGNEQERSLTYPQLMDLASCYPHFFAYLIKSKIPQGPRVTKLGTRWMGLVQDLVNAVMENLGIIMVFSFVACVVLISITVGIARNQTGTRAEFFGVVYTLSQTALDLFKILLGFLLATFSNSIPYFLRKLPEKLSVDYGFVPLLRKILFMVLLIVCGIHSVAETQNMRKLSNPEFRESFSVVFHNKSNQPRIGQLLKSNVFVTGMLLIVLSSLILALYFLEDLPLFIRAKQIMELRRIVLSSRYLRLLCFVLFVVLVAVHSTTTFLRDSIQVSYLLWLWLGAPTLVLVLDHLVLTFYTPMHEVEVLGFRAWEKRGVLLSIQKPTDCQFTTPSTVFLSFPSIPGTTFKELPLLSHPMDDHFTVFLPVNSPSTEDVNCLFCKLQSGHRESTQEEESTGVERLTPNRMRRSRPRRLTRLNTRVVYLNQTPPRDEASTSQAPQMARRSGSNFNLVFEISPASGSSEESSTTVDRQPQIMPRINEASHHVRDWQLIVPNRKIKVSVRGPYRCKQALALDGVIEDMLNCEMLVMMCSGIESLSLIPLCNELLRRLPVVQEGPWRLRRILLCWEVSSMEDVAWLVEVLEPLTSARSRLEVEIKIHVEIHRQRRNLNLFSHVFLKFLGDVLLRKRTTRIPTQSKVDIHFGKRDCVFQLEILRNENNSCKTGVIVDGSYALYELVTTWVNHNDNVDQFQLFL